MMRRTSLSERRGSFTLTPGMASARQRPRLMSQGGPSVTPVQRPKSRARSRRLSICNPESPAESDGWSDDEDAEWRAECRAEAIDALREGESVSKPPISGLFEDVYKDMPWNISRQLDETLAHAKRFPEEVPHGVPLH